MIEGLVVKTYSNIHQVLAGGRVVACKPRGRLRKEGLRVLAGDRVRLTVLDDHTGVIEEVLPRRAALVRPPVANVDLAVVVFTLREPDLNRAMLDRMMVLVEAAGLDALLCLNKRDLLAAGEADGVISCYRRAGYPVVLTAAKEGRGVEALLPFLQNRISVLAGQSGVGKSTLLNALRPGLGLRTGDLSARASRGRHTTRHVELLPVAGNGLVADTPGFSFLSLEGLARQDLAFFFPEMRPFSPRCRFSTCMHRQEPDCAVKEAVEAGQIDGVRYEHYLQFLSELEEIEARQY